MRSKLQILLFFYSGLLLSQATSSKDLEGKVYSSDGDVAATHVLNLTTKKATITDRNGFFVIPVHLHDTLAFSAVQYKKKIIVVTLAILESKEIAVGLDDSLTELEEVTVTPYNLSGDIAKDLSTLEIGPIITGQTLGLPNAYMKFPTKAERELKAATANPIMSFDPLINAITGRTKMLKKRVARNKLYSRTERVRLFYADSLYQTELGIPLEKIDDFLYFCEVDDYFQSTVDTRDRFKIWEYMRKKSLTYRANNNLD